MENKMKSILFSIDSVKAILEGRKTQTRRIARGIDNNCDGVVKVPGNKYAMFWNKDKTQKGYFECAKIKCPYGEVGDKFCVKTSWAVPAQYDNVKPTDIPKNAPVFSLFNNPDIFPSWCGKKRPGRFLPRFFYGNMPTGLITNIKCEKLHDISDEDAIAEGIQTLFTKEDCEKLIGIVGTKPEEHGYINYLWHGYYSDDRKLNKLIDNWLYQFSNYDKAKDSFSSFWQRINGEEYPWEESNFYVWVIEFKIL
jgi:hypothetical protein